MRRIRLQSPPTPQALLLVALITVPQLVAQQQPATQRQDPPTVEERFVAWSQKHPDQPLHAYVSFRNVAPDQQVLQFLERHGLTAAGVFTYVEGVHAVSRVRKPSGTALVNQARQRITETAQSRVDGMPVAFRKFLDENPQAKVVGDEKLTGLARSQLAILENNRAAVAAYRGNQPIIYAIHVSGSVAALREAAKDPLVQSLEPAFEVQAGRIAIPHPEPPQDARGGARVPPAVAGLAPPQVYQRMQELAAPRGGAQ